MRPVGLGDSFVRRQEQSAWGGRHVPLPPWAVPVLKWTRGAPPQQEGARLGQSPGPPCAWPSTPVALAACSQRTEGTGLRPRRGRRARRPLSCRCPRGPCAGGGGHHETRPCTPVPCGERVERAHSEPHFRGDVQRVSPPLRVWGASAPRGRGPPAHRYYVVSECHSPRRPRPTFWPAGRVETDASGDVAVPPPPAPWPARRPQPSAEGALRAPWVRGPRHPGSSAAPHGAHPRAGGAEHQGQGPRQPRKQRFTDPLDRRMYVQRPPAPWPPRQARAQPGPERASPESGSMSAASSSDPLDGADQHPWVHHGQDSSPWPGGPWGPQLAVGLDELVCSDV